MNNAILLELVQIRWILIALFVAVFVAILYFVIAMAIRVRASNTQNLLLLRDNCLAELTLLDLRGNYDELRAKSDEMLATYPNDLMANWYNALANEKTGQYGAALSALGRIKQINSAWSVEWVDKFIVDIRAKMKGPRSSDA